MHAPRPLVRSSARLLAWMLLSVTPPVAGSQDLSGLRDPQLREVASTELQAASAKGLPSQPFIAKALEGQLKAATPDKLRIAMRALATRLAAARAQLAPATDPELAAGADALGVGVAPAALKDTRRTWPTRSVALPLGVLTELVSRGIAPPKATRQVLALMTRGVTAQQLAALGHDVEDDIRNGRGAEAAFDLRVRGVLGALAPPLGVTVIPRP